MNSIENKELLSSINNLLLNQLNSFGQKFSKRFDAIEEKIEIIPQMQRDIRDIQEKIKVIPEMKSVIPEIQEQMSVIPEIQEQINVIPGMQNNIENMQNNIELMQGDIKELQYNYKNLYNETRNISRTVAKIEAEHGDKLAILFDAITGNIGKQEKLENRLNKFEKRIENNENQIYLLNSKIQNI